MILKLVSAAVLAVVAGSGAAVAQSANDFGGPREVPPASFSGQQYVDSKGCVFLRAGFGGRVTWVPRVNANRSQLCGYPPTFGNNQVAIAEPAAPAKPKVAAPVSGAPVSAAPVARRPMDTVASLTTPPRLRAVSPSQAKQPSGIARETYAPPQVGASVATSVPRVVATKPVAVPVPRPQPAAPVATRASGGKIGCYRDAPVAERFRLQGGGTVVLCTRGDGDLDAARPPRVLAGPAAVAPSGYLEVRGPAAAKRRPTPRVVASSQNQPALPKGYKAAFTDGRLNPNRGKGTQQGWADQDQVWTREVPARLVADAARAKGKTVVVRRVIASTKSQVASEALGKTATTARRYVQVGTFGQPANAQGALSRLSGLGLPVARSKITKGGRPLQIVLAGPFASTGAAQAALMAARRAGFGDAFIR